MLERGLRTKGELELWGVDEGSGEMVVWAVLWGSWGIDTLRSEVGVLSSTAEVED